MKFAPSLWQMGCPTCNFWQVSWRNSLGTFLQKGFGTLQLADAVNSAEALVKHHDSQPGKNPTFWRLHWFLSCTPPSRRRRRDLIGQDQSEEVHTTRTCHFLWHRHWWQHQRGASLVEGGACRTLEMEVRNPFEIEWALQILWIVLSNSEVTKVYIYIYIYIHTLLEIYYVFILSYIFKEKVRGTPWVKII